MYPLTRNNASGRFAPPPHGLAAALQNPLARGEWRGTWDPTAMVPVVALDSQPPLLAPVFLKMDVQGGECAAMRGATRFLEQTALVGVTMEWDDVGPARPWGSALLGPKGSCCAWLQQNVFRVFSTVHGLLPYGAFADTGAPLDPSRLCERNILRRWHLLVWDRPRPM